MLTGIPVSGTCRWPNAAVQAERSLQTGFPLASGTKSVVIFFLAILPVTCLIIAQFFLAIYAQVTS